MQKSAYLRRSSFHNLTFKISILLRYKILLQRAKSIVVKTAKRGGARYIKTGARSVGYLQAARTLC